MLSREDREKRMQENHRLVYDAYKHLTTLSSGSVVLLSVMLDKAFPAPSGRWAVGVAVVCFMGSVVCSVVMMLVSATTIEVEDRGGSPTAFDRGVSVALAGSIGLFLLGVLVLVLFVLVNSFA